MTKKRVTKKRVTTDLYALGRRLTKLVIQEDARGIVELLLSVDEKSRIALAGAARGIRDAVYDRRQRCWPAAPELAPHYDTTRLAMFGTDPLSEMRSALPLHVPHGHAELACDLIAARWPEKSAARSTVVRAIHVGNARFPRGVWGCSRELERRGIGILPDDEERVHTFIYSARCDGDAVEEIFRDPISLRFIWHFFDSPSAGRGLVSHDQLHTTERWDDAIVAMSERGILRRSALLDAVLRAMTQGDRSGIAWFARLHDKLAPRVDEIARRVDRYLGLLSSRSDLVLAQVHVALSTLFLRGRLPSREFLTAVVPALSAKGKQVTQSYVELLDRLAKKNPELAPQVAAASTGGLLHAAPELQSAALRLLARYGDPSDATLLAKIDDASSRLAASSRRELETWLGRRAAPSSSDGRDEERALRERSAALSPHWRRIAGVDDVLTTLDARSTTIPPLKIDPFTVPRLTVPLSPITTVDELIDTALVACEGTLSPDDLERVLDGISRLCRLRPEGFEARVAPLRHRAIERLVAAVKAWRSESLNDLMGIVLAWTTGEASVTWNDKPISWRNLVERANRYRRYPSAAVFLSQRLHEIARRVARGEARQLLSAPTHAGGFIDPAVLVTRATAPSADLHDEIVALLRLAPEHREHARAAARKVPGELGAALRYALGEDEPIGKTAALWYAAARARAPVGDDPAVEKRHPGGGADAARAARYRIDPAGLPKLERGSFSAEFEKLSGPISAEPLPRGDVPAEQFPSWHNPPPFSSTPAPSAWEGSLWPFVQQPAFRREARELSCFLESQGLYWKGSWEGLFDADVELGLPGTMLIALGLSAGHPTIAKLAEDALVMAIDDGRLDSALLGEAMAALLHWGEISLSRWAKALGEVASLTPLHLETLRVSVEVALGQAAKEPKTVASLLELLHQWTIEHGESISRPATRQWLESVEGSGKSAKLAKAILAVAKISMEHRRAVCIRALGNRIDRAERWQRIERAAYGTETVRPLRRRS